MCFINHIHIRIGIVSLYFYYNKDIKSIGVGLMDEKRLREIIIQNINNLMNTDQNQTSSMRNISTCIGASGNYIQNILSGSTSPSIRKLIAIANYFDIEPWMLLVDYNNGGEEMASLLNLISSCPKDMYPVIESFIKYMLEHQAD